MNEITIVVKSRDETKPGFDSSTARTEKLGTAAKGTQGKLGDLSREFELAKTKGDWFGRMAEGNANVSDFLTRHLEGLRGETRRLAEEFNRTGNTDLLGKIFDSRKVEQDLGKLKNDLTKSLAAAGQQGGQEMIKALGGSVSAAASTPGIGPILVGGIIAAIVAALPAINGLLLGGIGLGGIGLGIVGQLKNSDVRAAVAGLGHDLEATLTGATTSFIGPLQGAAHILSAELRNDIKSIDFSQVVKQVEPLAAGLGGLFTQMMPGFNQAMRAAGPILQALAQELPHIGHALSDMFSNISADSHGAAEGLRTIVMFLDDTIEAVGLVIRFFSKWEEIVIDVSDKIAHIGAHIPIVGGLFQKFADKLDHIKDGDPLGTLPDRLGQTGDQAQAAAAAVGALSGQIVNMITESQQAAATAQQLFTVLMGVDQGTLHWDESLTRLHDTLAKNGRNLNEHTKAGQENVSAILASVQANMQLYQAQVAAGLGADDAAKAYDQNERALERQLRAAGYTQSQIDGLIGKYRGIPDAVSPAQQALQRSTDAVNRLVDALDAIFHLPSHKDFAFNVAISGLGGGVLGSLAGLAVGHHAAGGIGSGLTWVGEEGRELVKLPQGSQVYPHGQSEQMAVNAAAQQPTRGDGAAVFLGPGLDSVFATYLQRLIATGQIKIS